MHVGLGCLGIFQAFIGLVNPIVFVISVKKSKCEELHSIVGLVKSKSTTRIRPALLPFQGYDMKFSSCLTYYGMVFRYMILKVVLLFWPH